MKKSGLLIFLSLLFFLSCKKDKLPYSSQFENSYQQWSTYKSSIKNSYSYISYSGSVFSFSSETKITVNDGKVVARAYTQHKSSGPIAKLMVGWTEDQSNLNSHTEGAASLTLDEIYQKAKSEWLAVDKAENDILFDTDNNGLIANCGYVPKGCMDDCFNGIHIKSITAL